MRERPILFSGEMVRAILNGTKTQTRRVISLRHGLEFFGGRGDEDDPTQWGYFFDGPEHHGYCVIARGFNQRFNNGLVSMACPFGEVGDRLWVRETWQLLEHMGYTFDDDAVVWRATAPNNEVDLPNFNSNTLEVRRLEVLRWRPSMHMPRWASRITLEITNVRVERLNDISEDDARAEGVGREFAHDDREHTEGERLSGYHPIMSHGIAFARLWNCLYAKSAPWDSNPWVWVVEFKRVEGGAA